jgi:TetR/AcrR family transcriptional regulator, cholesterol catabolism regulator
MSAIADGDRCAEYNPHAPKPVVSRAVMRTAEQHERRLRIVEEALYMAADGHEAVNIRVLAKQADVAIGTIYYYFPSKEHLWVACLEYRLGEIEHRVKRECAHIADPYHRLLHATERLVTAINRTPLLADAVARSLFASAEAALVVEDVRQQLIEMFANAMGNDQPTRLHHQIGELLADVWATNLMAVVQERITGADFHLRLVQTIDVLAHHFRGG